MTLKKNVLIVVITLVVICFLVSAGCTSTPSMPTTPAKSVGFADIAGVWYSTSPYYDEGINDKSMLKLEINPDGTGTETWYTVKFIPYCSNTFRANPTVVGSFNLSFDPPLDTNWWHVTLLDTKLSSTLGVDFSRTKWDGYDSANAVPTISTEHNPDDYVKEGNYYLEDDYGRSFTETLWTGDVAPYVEEYKSFSKMGAKRSQAGEWIKFVRKLSTGHHAYESTKPVRYQTIDETMSLKSGTCDDLAILAARGLKELGIDVAILVFPEHMDVGIGKDGYNYVHKYIQEGGYYSVYNSDNNLYDGYYYLDITDYQNILDIGEVVTETNFKYDMRLKKVIPL